MNQPLNTEVPCPEPAPKKKKQSPLVVWAALLLGLITPFGLYYALQSGSMLLAGVCFGLLAFAMVLTAWKG
ncbi:MAG: hypothetical protein AAGU05_00355 [Anaerolineaceae bacterium]